MVDAAKRKLIDRIVELGRELEYVANEKQIRNHAKHFTLEQLQSEVEILEQEKAARPSGQGGVIERTTGNAERSNATPHSR